jgi:hypothetical protein
MRNREPATEEDARNGSAAFFVPESTRSKVFDLGVALPAGAVLLEEVGEENPVPAGTRVQLIQAEILDDLHVLLGFTYDGGVGICTLEGIAIESDEKDELGSAIDVRVLAFELLEEAKRNMQLDKYLRPIAFVVKSNKAIRAPLSFQGIEQKHAAYKRLVQLAKAHRALAIITVNDVHLSRENDDDDGYYEGKLEATKSPEAIWVTVSGPAITGWSITAPYTRNCEQIAFGPAKEDLGVQINLLQGWASEQVLPKN